MTHTYSEADVGKFFQHRQTGKVYECVAFCRSPSVILHAVDSAYPRDEQSFGVGGLTAQEFVRLVPEGEATSSPAPRPRPDRTGPEATCRG